MNLCLEQFQFSYGFLLPRFCGPVFLKICVFDKFD